MTQPNPCRRNGAVQATGVFSCHALFARRKSASFLPLRVVLQHYILFKEKGVTHFMAEKLKIIPLGGLNEIGKNMTAYEYGGEIIVVTAAWPSRR